MHVDYTKICRVCMSSATRDIFVRSTENGNPLERLLEKLRYVTMMKIEENDDLPRLLCDLCIVQLNVAYNFKRQAIENDTKLRQYFIENGITGTIPCTNINEATSNVNQSSPSSSHSCVTNTSLVQSQQKNNFPIRPIIIKEEPSEEDIIFTTEISAMPSATTSTVVSSKNSILDKNIRSMVYINSLASTSGENYHHNYNIATTSTESVNINRTKPDSSNNNLKKNMRKQLAEKRVRNVLKTKRVLPENIIKSAREISKLSINMVPPTGKLSRKEMKQNVNYKQNKKQPTTNFNTGANVSNSNSKRSNTKIKTKAKTKNNIDSEHLFNPFNESNNIKKKSKTYSRQTECPKSKLITPKIEPDTN